MSGRYLLVVAALAVAVQACGAATSDGDEALPGPSAATEASSAPASDGSVADTDTGASGEVEGDAAPAPPASQEPADPAPGTDVAPREATASDAAAFLSTVQPEGVRGLDGVAVDLDADGTHEVVLSGVRDGRGWLALAAWDGRGYELVAEGVGGRGDRVVQVSVSDVNGDDLREVVLEVSGDGAGSLTLWQVPGRVALEPLAARGGCHDGSNVYGAVGARLVPAPVAGVLDVAATCDDAPLPRADWSTQRWSWDGEAYSHVPEGPGNSDGNGNGNGPPPGTPRGGSDADGDGTSAGG